MLESENFLSPRGKIGGRGQTVPISLNRTRAAGVPDPIPNGGVTRIPPYVTWIALW